MYLCIYLSIYNETRNASCYYHNVLGKLQISTLQIAFFKAIFKLVEKFEVKLARLWKIAKLEICANILIMYFTIYLQLKKGLISPINGSYYLCKDKKWFCLQNLQQLSQESFSHVFVKRKGEINDQ